MQTPLTAADNIIQEAATLGNLVRELNCLAEMDSGELSLIAERCALRELLTAEGERWPPQALSHQILLLLDPRPELAMLDSTANGESSAGHHIERRAAEYRNVRAGQRFGKMGMDRSVEISVTDNGDGIDAADLPHVFDRFFRTDDSRSRGTPGRGLGLAIARDIVEAHNGAIAALSEVR